jgi:Zn finger protein HypA/HybF involved in hydrogenase expression
MDDFQIEIPLPSDVDGFILLQCQFCGEFFKITPDDFQDDRILKLRCPACGLSNDSFITEDAIELAGTKANNIAKHMLNKELSKIENKFKGSFLSIKIEKKYELQPENPLRTVIDNLETALFRCCQRKAKIKLILKISGCYCPFCGVKNYELE